MEEWKTYKISDLCLKVTDGSHFSPAAQDTGYPMFSVKDMQEYGFDYSKCKRISQADFDIMKNSGCVPEEGDVLVAKDGSYLKQIFVCRRSLDEAILSSIAIFRPDRSKILPDYLCYLIKSPKVYDYISKNCVSGSALPRIVLKAFKDVELEVPSLATQERIVSKLKCIDEKIILNNRINHNLLNLAQELFNNSFVKNSCCSDTCRAASLLDIAEYLNGLAMQKYPATDGEVGIPVLKIKELGQQACDANSDKCSESIPAQYVVNDGDIIFSWSGTLLVDFWCGGICGLNQHLFKVSSDKFPNWFVYFWTKHHLDRFIRIAKDKAVTMGHIKRGDLGKAEVIIPEASQMEELDEEIRPLISEYIDRRVENRKLQNLRDSLLPELMLGNLTC